MSALGDGVAAGVGPNTRTSAFASRTTEIRWLLLSPCSRLSPGVSNNSILAGVTFLGLKSLTSPSKRRSGRVAMPACPVCALEGSGLVPVSSSKMLLLPPP